MAGAPPRYSEEQREAFIAAVIDGGTSAAAALELAKAGKLAGLPAFSPSYDQVTEWVRIRRRDILAKTPPAADDYDAISRRLWAQHVAEIDRLERDLRKKKRTDADKERMARQLGDAIKRHKRLPPALDSARAPSARCRCWSRPSWSPPPAR